MSTRDRTTDKSRYPQAPMFAELSYVKPKNYQALPYCIAFHAGTLPDGSQVLAYPTQVQGYGQSAEELLLHRKEIALRAAVSLNELYVLKHNTGLKQNTDGCEDTETVKQIYIIEAPHCLVRLSQAEKSADISVRQSAPLCRSYYPNMDGVLISVDRNYTVNSNTVCFREIVFISDSITSGIEIWNKVGQPIWCVGQPLPTQHFSSTRQGRKQIVKVPRYSLAQRQPIPTEGEEGSLSMYLPLSGGHPTDKELDGLLVPQHPSRRERVRTTRGDVLRVDDHYAPVTQ